MPYSYDPVKADFLYKNSDVGPVISAAEWDLILGTLLNQANANADLIKELMTAVDAISNTGLGVGSVQTTNLADDVVTADKLANNAVVTANVVDGSITAAKLAEDAVTTRIGEIIMWPGVSAVEPDGAGDTLLYCNGASVLQSAYPELFAILGTAYGVPVNAGTHFVLPDFREKVPYGVGVTETIGTTYGSNTKTLTTAETPVKYHAHEIMHTHTGTTNNYTHSHTITGYYYSNNTAGGAVQYVHPSAGSTFSLPCSNDTHQHTISTNTQNTNYSGNASDDTATAFDLRQKSLAIRFYIQAK